MVRTRRTLTSEFKAKVVLQLIGGEKRLADIYSEYKLNKPKGTLWQPEFLHNTPCIFERKKSYSEEQ